MKKRFYKFVCVGLVLLLIFSLAACQNGQNPNADSGTDSLTESSNTQSETESESESESETEPESQRQSVYISSGQSGSWDVFLEELEANKDKIGDHAQEKIEMMSRRIDFEGRLISFVEFVAFAKGWKYHIMWQFTDPYIVIEYCPNGYTREPFLSVIDEENQIYLDTGDFYPNIWIYYSDTLRGRIHIGDPASWSPEREAIFEVLKEYALESFRMASQWE